MRVRNPFALIMLAVTMTARAAGPGQEAGPSAALPKPEQDVLVFTNGDQLTGHLVRAQGGKVVFKSDMAGEVTVAFDKIKLLKSGTEFALIRNGQRPVKLRDLNVSNGTVDVAENKLVMRPRSATLKPDTVAAKDVGLLLDKAAFDKEMAKKSGLLNGWTGSIAGGATFSEATQTGEAYNASLNVQRTMPQQALTLAPFVQASGKTIVAVSETYSRVTSPVIPPPTPPSPNTVAVSSLFQASVEQDETFSPRFYALESAAYLHSYSQGIQLQQVYAGGVGWTAVKDAKQELNLKAAVSYESQMFLQTAGAATVPDVNTVGGSFNETYTRKLPYKAVFTQSGAYVPSFTNMQAYTLTANATLQVPVSKRLSTSVSVTDNYLGNPAPYYKNNNFQLVTGISYALR